jgi:DNA-binding NtrC family response regulator
MGVRTALFADTDRIFGWRLKMLAQQAGIMAEFSATLDEAKRMLVSSQPLLFFSNVRLGGARGAELVHLARMANPRTRAILYGGTRDILLARQAQDAGAFFEPLPFLPHAMAHYFTATLPARDRRDAARPERRKTFRGGRRATDIESLHQAHVVPA